MLNLILNVIGALIFIIILAVLLAICVSAIFSAIKENDAVSLVVGVLASLIFLFVCLLPFAYTQKCHTCNESYSYEYQYCPKDGTKLEE